ncbi:MAG: flagellar basal body rod protein FlgB [Dissulfurimicrobium sp.]|uniref:flagellar basal body rod protein FlgB n=1 Tax=Dissulfurimicrobium TaxID=1769732 RepID=UPI001EDBFEA5|nr:flagellar basal body rod protein FlgB [Dissulfurimicrobium hydrothermale]UKL13760.1 flagellar basal body rod protein FlgB [Dissulfurimicrobium hydrothermale]
MKQLFGRIFNTLERAIELETLRNTVITSNITNLDTPGYKAKDVPFKEIMARYLDNPPGGLAMSLKAPSQGHMISMGGSSLAVTDKAHIQTAGGSYGADAVVVRSDERGTPNNVDLDSEMAELAINNIRFQETVQSLIKQFEMLKTAITEGGKV